MLTPVAPSPVGSRALNLALVAMLSQKLDFMAWNLTRKSTGGRPATVDDNVHQLALIVSGSVDAVIRQSADDGYEVLPVSWDAGELVMMSQLFSREPFSMDLGIGFLNAIRRPKNGPEKAPDRARKGAKYASLGGFSAQVWASGGSGLASWQVFERSRRAAPPAAAG